MERYTVCCSLYYYSRHCFNHSLASYSTADRAKLYRPNETLKILSEYELKLQEIKRDIK